MQKCRSEKCKSAEVDDGGLVRGCIVWGRCGIMGACVW